MRGAYRTLVILAIVFGAVAVLCMVAPTIAPTTYGQADLMRPEILTAGLAQLVRAPATVFALIFATAAVFVRAVAWRPRPGTRGFSARREP